MFEIMVRTRFAAAHQLNLAGRKCENLHGHNWKVEVFVKGETLDHAGVLYDFGLLKKSVNAVMDELDHKFLNELDELFPQGSPSSERIAVYIAQRLAPQLPPGITVSRINAWESDDSCATYIPSVT